MKNKAQLSRIQPNEDEIRDYAYLLYQQSDGTPGHDLEHWYEATALLKANIPSRRTGLRHRGATLAGAV